MNVIDTAEAGAGLQRLAAPVTVTSFTVDSASSAASIAAVPAECAIAAVVLPLKDRYRFPEHVVSHVHVTV